MVLNLVYQVIRYYQFRIKVLLYNILLYNILINIIIITKVYISVRLNRLSIVRLLNL